MSSTIDTGTRVRMARLPDADAVPSPDKVVVITGCSRGIGRGLCEYFLQSGWLVIGMSRTIPDIQHLSFRHYQLDITDERSVVDAFKSINDSYGFVDLLINNAGTVKSGPVLLMPVSSVTEMVSTNLQGAFIVSRECVRLMMGRSRGRVVSIGSMLVPIAPAGDAIYSATKAALSVFTQILAKEVSGYGITCNVVGVTAIDTGMAQSVRPDQLIGWIESLPLRRPATMEDLINVVEFFASERSSNITGQVIYLGGIS